MSTKPVKHVFWCINDIVTKLSYDPRQTYYDLKVKGLTEYKGYFVVGFDKNLNAYLIFWETPQQIGDFENKLAYQVLDLYKH